MPTAILIGYEYKNKNILQGVYIDLYQAHKWCQTFCSSIFILTDIREPPPIQFLKKAISQKIVDVGIFDFWKNIQTKLTVLSVHSLVASINLIPNVSDQKLIIYYTGHGKIKENINFYDEKYTHCMLLPCGNFLSFSDFKKTIIKKFHNCEIFWILDCCNPHGLHFPYKLQDNNFYLEKDNKIEFIIQPSLCIISSNINQKSIITPYGSIFSRHLFRKLIELNEPFKLNDNLTIPNSRNRNLQRMVGYLNSSIKTYHTGYYQNVSIYSSYIMDPVLWDWIGSNKNYDIVPDPSLEILIIRHNS